MNHTARSWRTGAAPPWGPVLAVSDAPCSTQPHQWALVGPDAILIEYTSHSATECFCHMNTGTDAKTSLIPVRLFMSLGAWGVCVCVFCVRRWSKDYSREREVGLERRHLTVKTGGACVCRQCDQPPTSLCTHTYVSLVVLYCTYMEKVARYHQ